VSYSLCVLSVLCGYLFVTPACSKPDSPPPAADAAPAPAAAPSVTSERVVGKVPPPTAGIPVIVVLEPKPPALVLVPQTEKPVMDQVSLTFGPALLFVRTGQPAEFRNSDDTLHNVHVTHEETKEPQFNVAIPTGESYSFTFKRDGFYHVGCDIHPAMAADIFASTSPYVALAESDGSFAMNDVPAGSYVATMYSSGKRTQKDVDIKGGVTNLSIE
jgi:plastocyanin